MEVRAPGGRVWTVRRPIAWPRRRLPADIVWPPVELDPTGLVTLILFPLILAAVLAPAFSLA